jgi:glycosyltransferase involved in cell wall biosynthesis
MTPRDPLVSIIIPAYQAERWIGASVESAALQTWASVEIIVVDDGSTDQTADVARSLGDSRVTVIRQANRGAASARNRGLEIATGELIQYLDADDLLAPDKIERQLEALSAAPAGSVSSCSWGKFSDDAARAAFSPEDVWTESNPEEWVVRSLAGEGMMQPAAWLIPRSVADRAGRWNDALTLHDDGEYFTRVLLSSARNVFVPEARVFYRDVEGSLSRRRSRRAIESAFEVCRLREHHVLEVRNDKSAREAVATQYAQFIYEHGSTAPDLAESAVRAMTALDAEPRPVIGGNAFRALSRTIGFRHAYALRKRAKA